jgi:hypothetical protein
VQLLKIETITHGYVDMAHTAPTFNLKKVWSNAMQDVMGLIQGCHCIHASITTRRMHLDIDIALHHVNIKST